MDDANGGDLKRRRGHATARRSPNLAADIRALSSRIKMHVDELKEGREEDDPEVIKLGRQERNYNALALKLAKAIEESEVKNALSEGIAETLKVGQMLEVKQPTATFRRVDVTRRRRTASEIYDTAYGVSQPANENAEKQGLPTSHEKEPLVDEQLFAPDKTKKQVPTREQQGEHVMNKQLLASTNEKQPPTMAVAADMEPQMPTQPRIQMPAFVVNPHKNIKEAGGPWRHYKEKDFGASCRKWFSRPPGKGEPTIEPIILRKHEWTVSMVADLLFTPGVADTAEKEDNLEVPKVDWEKAFVGDNDPKLLHNTTSDPDGNLQDTDHNHGNKLEDYVSEAATPTNVEKSQTQAKPEPSSKKVAFNWKAFGIKTESSSSPPIPAPVPVLVMKDVGAPRTYDSKQHIVKEADMEDNADEEADLKRQDSPMNTTAFEVHSRLAPELGKTFSMEQMLPKGGTNTRGRFLNPNDPRRNNLDGSPFNALGGRRAPKRRRSLTPELRGENLTIGKYQHTELRDSPMKTIETERSTPESAAEKPVSLIETTPPTYRTNQRGRFFEPQDPRRSDTLRTSLQNFHDLKRSRSSSPDSTQTKRKAVCRSCWQRGEFCTSKGQCKECKLSGRACVYAHCLFGLGCRKRRCAYLHPGQFEDGNGGEWSAVAGDLGRKNGLH